jgi:cytochrome c-type biogenesis protein CcmF
VKRGLFGPHHNSQRVRPPLSACAYALAHAGLAVTLMGVAGTTLWRSESLQVLAPGAHMHVGGYDLRFDGVSKVRGPNFEADMAHVSLMDGAAVVAVMKPQKRFYPVEGQEVSDTAIRTNGVRDIYLALGDERAKDHWVLRAYVSPLAPFIWLGALVMALGGGLGLLGRLRKRGAA